MKVFITRIIPKPGLQLLQDAGITILDWKEKRGLTPQELIQYCKQCDALLSVGDNKLDGYFLKECSHLKVIALHSVGYDRVDIQEATRLKIPIGNTPGVLSTATADIAFLLMMAVSRKAFYHNRRIKQADWNFFEPTSGLGIELQNKTLGIFGLGKIGFEMAKRCVAFYNMNVIYHNRSNNVQAEKKIKAVKVSFNELLEQSDVLSIHTSLTAETKGKFNREAFARMKPSSILINTARGAIIVEKDLIHAMQNKTIWGAGLDVTDPEPMDKDNPLLTMTNTAVLPHIGSATVETRNAMSVMAAQNVIAGLKDERIPFPVNPKVYEK